MIRKQRPRSSFSKDPFFFGNYYIKNIAAYGLASAAILISKDFFAHYSIFWLLCLVPLFMTQFRLQQLSAGLVVFRYMHLLHHTHPDDPENDPHPPKGYSFWQFVDTARVLVGRRLESKYLQIWGDTIKTRATWRQQGILIFAARFCKTLFVFSLLGPRWFVVAFLPSYVANVLLYAGFNYYTHAEQPDGSIEVKDLKGTLYFDLCNRFLFGIMYHKTHHLFPNLFNPMKATNAK